MTSDFPMEDFNACLLDALEASKASGILLNYCWYYLFRRTKSQKPELSVDLERMQTQSALKSDAEDPFGLEKTFLL